ncbi:MAG: hypothetical protein WCW26_00325 [Candidatus Buchananbacteria bacterium]
MKNQKILFVTIVIIFLLVIVGVVYLAMSLAIKTLSAPENILSFDDCAKAGYPIMETYPEQCKTKDGRTFVRKILEPEVIADLPASKYNNAEFGFSFWYPKDSEIRKENLEGYLSLSKTGLVGIFLPKDLFAGTNLGEVVVIVGVSTSTEILSKCEQINTINDEKDLGQAIIGILPAHKFSAVGVGAGNIYESTIYRLVKNQSCYEIVEMLHSGNIYNYDPGTVKEFDQDKFSGILEEMVQTLGFSN